MHVYVYKRHCLYFSYVAVFIRKKKTDKKLTEY